jgi:uncharacterized protein involved in outer membrane biogenesis
VSALKEAADPRSIHNPGKIAVYWKDRSLDRRACRPEQAKGTDLGRILAIFATILVLLLAAAFIAPAVVDWNDYKASIEKTASALLGRNVRIGGEISAVLLPEPHLRVRDLTAGNGKGGVTLTAESADIALSLQALFSGRLVADRVTLKRPYMTLDFSQPAPVRPIAAAAGPDFAAEIGAVDIEDGRLAIFAKGSGLAETFGLTNVSGSIAAAPGEAYRFTGRVSHNGRQFDVKFTAAPAQNKAIKVAATAQEAGTKASYQAEGLLSGDDDPSFQGALSLNIPQTAAGPAGLPFDIQLRSAGTFSFSEAALSEIVLTIDPQNREQIVTGSATIAFGARTAALTLRAASLDADALLSASAGQGLLPGVASPDWSGFKSAAAGLLWLYPEYTVSLAFESGMIQLKGEPVERVKLHGSRSRQGWVFEEALAALPGDTSLKLAGKLTKVQGEPQFVATVALDGKSPSRLMRWLAPSGPAGKSVHAGAFSLRGTLSLTNEATGFEGIEGSLDGTPFTANLHLDKAPQRRLQLALKSSSLDLTAFETVQEDGASLSAEALQTAWQAGLSQLAATLGAGPDGLQTADVDISAGAIKTSTAEAKNVAIHVKFDPSVISVSKLSAETATGLVVKGEGSLPLRGPGQGRFEGRIEAQSPQAAVQLAVLAGYGRTGLRNRAAAMAPAVLSISAQTSAGTAAALLSGTLGTARVDGRVQLNGTLSEWRNGQLSAQLKFSGPDGNKLLAIIFPDAAFPPAGSPSPGTLSLSLTGLPAQLETMATLSAGPLQMQLNGTTALDAQSLTFKGKVDASSQTPEQFLPAPVLALLGGEPRANLHVSASIAAGSSGFEARGLRAEAPKSVTAGQLAIAMSGGVTKVNAELNADQISLPSLLGHFLSGAPDPISLNLTAAAPPADIWSGRPFSLSAFRETQGKVTLNAKAMKLSDALVIAGGRFEASLENGRLDLAILKGKALGGDFEASLSLTAKENAVAADARISLSGADLAQLPAPGTGPALLGQASLSLSAAGQGLSPRGLISVLRGRGFIRVSDGQLVKLTPVPVEPAAAELLAEQLPLTEDAISKKVLQAVQSGNFSFRHLKVPVTVQDGILEIRRASFRSLPADAKGKTAVAGKDGTVRLQAYLDLNKAQVDSTWQMGVLADRRNKWQPVKVMLAGPLRELGARPKTLAAEDFVRAVLVHKMEGDITRLEGLNKPPPQPASKGWTASQQSAPKPKPHKPKAAPAATVKPAPPALETVPARTYEQRMRDAVENAPGPATAR